MFHFFGCHLICLLDFFIIIGVNGITYLCEGAFGRQQKMRDMGVDKQFQSMLVYSDPNLTEVYVSVLLFTLSQMLCCHQTSISTHF